LEKWITVWWQVDFPINFSDRRGIVEDHDSLIQDFKIICLQYWKPQIAYVQFFRV
jgi:hypothetical protein